MPGLINSNDEDIRIVNGIYTPLELAQEEVWNRWANVDLKERVNSYLKHIPDFIGESPKAILGRHIATPNYEFHMAYKLARRLGLKLIISEFLCDRFCVNNIVKLGLGRLRFFYRLDKNSNYITKKVKIIDIPKNDRELLNEIITYTGEKLIDFHHRLFNRYCRNVSVIDSSEWFKRQGSKASEFYPYFLSLFVCHGVLLETYWILSSKEEREFVFNVVKPAFDQVTERFGVKPIIVQLLDNKEDGSLIWESYPAYLLKMINKV